MTTSALDSMAIAGLDDADEIFAKISVLDLLTSIGDIVRRGGVPDPDTIAELTKRRSLVHAAVGVYRPDMLAAAIVELYGMAERLIPADDPDDEVGVALTALDELGDAGAQLASDRDRAESIVAAVRYLGGSDPTWLADELARCVAMLVEVDRGGERAVRALIAANPFRRGLCARLATSELDRWWLRRTECPIDVLRAESWSEGAIDHARTCVDCARDAARALIFDEFLRPATSHHPVLELEDLVARRSVPAPVRAAVLRHRDTCESCAALFDELQQIWDREPPPPGPPKQWDLRPLAKALDRPVEDLDAWCARKYAAGSLAVGHAAGGKIRGLVGDVPSKATLRWEPPRNLASKPMLDFTPALAPELRGPVDFLLADEVIARGDFGRLDLVYLEFVPEFTPPEAGLDLSDAVLLSLASFRVSPR